MSLCLVLVFGAFAHQSAAFASGPTVRVDDNPDNGWVFNFEPPFVTPADFTLEAASLGQGSLHVAPIENVPFAPYSGPEKLILRHYPTPGTSMDDFGAFSIDFLIDAAGAQKPEQFYVNLYTVSPSEDSWYSCRYDYVADTGSDSTWTALSFDSTEPAAHVETKTVADCGTSPSNVPSHDLLFISVNLGDTSANDQDVGGYFDNAQLTLAGSTTTYDFEVNPNACKAGGWHGLERPDGSSFKNQGECIQYVLTGN